MRILIIHGTVLNAFDAIDQDDAIKWWKMLLM